MKYCYLTLIVLLFAATTWAATHYITLEPAMGKPLFLRDTAKQFSFMSTTHTAISLGYKHKNPFIPVSINFNFAYIRGPATTAGLAFTDGTSITGISKFKIPELTVKYHFYGPNRSIEPYAGMGFQYFMYGNSGDMSAYTTKQFKTLAVDFVGGLSWYIVNTDSFIIQAGLDMSFVPFISYNFSETNFANGTMLGFAFHLTFGWGFAGPDASPAPSAEVVQ